MNRNDKNKKYTPLNINNVFKAKTVDTQNKTSYRVAGMQNIGKVSSMRRVPAPKWVPSIKAETGASENRQIINQSSSGWVNPTSHDINDPNIHRMQSSLNKDKNQWISKGSSNKPFFLMGQEFPSLPTDGVQDTPSGSDLSKDSAKIKETDTVKSKLDEIRNRDNTISASTLNRIDALSISKSSKGDIAATGWAAEDEEPNFDEKIVFSDEESPNETQNWHSDPEDVVNKFDPTHMTHDTKEQHRSMGDTWFEQTQTPHYPQFQQFPMQVNMPNQFLANAQFSQNILNRTPTSVVTNDDQSAFLNSVAEQRNARNMEYYFAIERARQKKMGTHIGRQYGAYNEEMMHADQMASRSRQTSMTSDTPDSMNTPIEMGPPGGPPLMHGHLHTPHISPMMHNTTMPMISPPLSGPPSMMRFAQPPFMIPAVSMEHIADPKLMEKWVEFLKLQRTSEASFDSSMATEQPQPQAIQVSSKITETRNVTEDSAVIESVRPTPHSPMITKEPPVKEDVADNKQDPSDTTLKSKYTVPSDDDVGKSDNSKRYSRNKCSNVKEYRPTKHGYKGEYSAKSDKGSTEYSEHYRGDDDVAYEDYHVYQQHYPSERHRDFKSGPDYRRNAPYNYYDESYHNDINDYSYRSNSLKYKATKNKEYKPGPQSDAYQPDRGSSSNTQEFHPTDKDNFAGADNKGNKDPRRSAKPPATYSNKRYDNRSYKERPTENPQEFSMGFAVNPKDSHRNNYYSNNYARRPYSSEYSYYSSYPPSSGAKYSDDDYYYSDQYPEQYQDKYQYEHSATYSNSKPTTKKPPLKVIPEQWRTKEPPKSENGQTRSNGRTTRKSDKRPSSMAKESCNDNDQDEWETASEGGSGRSNSGPRDVFKSMGRHQGDQLTSSEDSGKRPPNSSSDNQRGSDNRGGSGNTCNGTWPSYPDDDESDGASGPAAGTKSNLSQNKSSESTQNQNSDQNSSNKSRTNDSTSKDGSNNSNSHKEPPKQTERHIRTFTDFIDISKSSSVINVDKLPEVTEDEELLYENVEQFQEVLSKSAKKNRKLEEQRRLKEEMEQKRLEALRIKKANDIKNLKKPLIKKELPQKPDKVDSFVSRKIDNKTAVINRDKDVTTNTFKKYESNKGSMQIGSWDNSLADEMKVPKPIGTPASTSSWNVKMKSIPSTNSTTAATPTVSRGSTETVKEPNKAPVDVNKPQLAKNAYVASSESADIKYNSSITFPYKNSIFDRANEEKKMKGALELKSADKIIADSITFEYEVKNLKEDKPQRGAVMADRPPQKNDQQSLNDKINSVKTIWDSQAIGPANNEQATNRSSTLISAPDTVHTTTSSIQDAIISRCVDVNLATPALSITNVCKVKPQLQQDFIKKDPNEPMMSSSGFAIRNSPATFITPNQGNFLPYRFPSEFLQDMRSTDALASLLSNNQAAMHINYNLPNPHMLDSSLLRQNPQDHMLSNKMNFISQSSFYPQPAVTPKLFSNAPLSMDISSSHGALPLQQLLLTRQNSLTGMMQPNGMQIPFLQGGQQHAQTPLFPAAPMLTPSNYQSQLNPFSQGHMPAHYSPGNFHQLHPSAQFQQNQQLLLNQQQQQQQMIQNQISHDRVINSGQSGIFNSIIGSSDISTNTGLPDFSATPKHLNNTNNIMHGINGSAIMLPHNLNILMKPHLFATSSQYNGFQAPIQSHHLNVRNSYDNHSNLKLATDMDPYKSDNGTLDRSFYCIDNYVVPKQREDFYIDQNEYETCDISNENWANSLRQSNPANILQTLDFQSQRSPIHFPLLDPGMMCSDNPYRNFLSNQRDNHPSMGSGVHNNPNFPSSSSSHRNKQQYNPDHACHANKQIPRGYDNPTFVPTNQSFGNKNEIPDNKKGFVKSTRESTTASEPSDSLGKDIANSEKSFSANDKHTKQRSSLSDNFEDKTQAWSLAEDDPAEGLKVAPSAHAEDASREVSSHSPSKPYPASRSNMFDNQCQFGYDSTQLSSQTAESLGKYDSYQMKKMIMKLREGPVMTFDSFEGSAGGGVAAVPRPVHYQAPRSKPCPKTYGHEATYGPECAGMGFYSKGRALTPPVARHYKNRVGGRYSQHSSSSSGHHPQGGRFKADCADKDEAGCGDYSCVGVPQLDCDQLIVENIINSPVL